MILAAFVIVGCGAKLKPDGPKKDKEPIVVPISTNAAEGTRYSEGKDRTPLWKVRWASQKLTIGEGGEFFGDMFTVSGELFKKGAAASTFKADKAHVDRQSNVLILEGHVVVETSNPKGAVQCDSAIWHPEREYGEAHGNVRFVTDEYTMGTFDVFCFSAELNAGGTPDLFGEKYGK